MVRVDPMRRFRKVLVAGTFDLFHAGHRSILQRAFDCGDFVVVGVTSDRMMKAGFKGHRVELYRVRLMNVKAFISERGLSDRSLIVRIDDVYGPAISDPDAEAIVVSPETAARALEINDKRREAGLKPLELIEQEFVMAADGKPIGSSRIRAGLIDREGRSRKAGRLESFSSRS